MSTTHMLLTVYAAGVLVGLAVMRDAWPERVATALLWPLGLVALVVVAAIMILAAAYLWPVPVLGAAALVAGLAWIWAHG